jgi:hypothetical protein
LVLILFIAIYFVFYLFWLIFSLILSLVIWFHLIFISNLILILFVIFFICFLIDFFIFQPLIFVFIYFYIKFGPQSFYCYLFCFESFFIVFVFQFNPLAFCWLKILLLLFLGLSFFEVSLRLMIRVTVLKVNIDWFWSFLGPFLKLIFFQLHPSTFDLLWIGLRAFIHFSFYRVTSILCS